MNLFQLLPLLIIAVNASPYDHLFNRDDQNSTIVEFDKHPYLAQVIVDCPSSWSDAKLGVILSAEYVLMADTEQPANCGYSVWINQDNDNKNASKHTIESMHMKFIGSDFKGFDLFWSELNLILFKLSEPIKPGSLARSIRILDKVVSGDNGVLLRLIKGSGPRESFRTYEANSTALDVLDCKMVEGMYVAYHHHSAPNDTMCTIEPISIFPTSGSTLLVINGQLVGWMFGIRFIQYDGVLEQMSLYALVSKHENWIKSYTGIEMHNLNRSPFFIG